MSPKSFSFNGNEPPVVFRLKGLRVLTPPQCSQSLCKWTAKDYAAWTLCFNGCTVWCKWQSNMKFEWEMISLRPDEHSCTMIWLLFNKNTQETPQCIYLRKRNKANNKKTKCTSWFIYFKGKLWTLWPKELMHKSYFKWILRPIYSAWDSPLEIPPM